MKETWDELKIIADECREKQKNISKYKVVLFGAGALGVTAYETIKEDMDIYALADNNPELHGKKMTKYGNLEVLPVTVLEEKKEDFFVIIIAMARHYEAIKAQLSERGIRSITYLEYILATKFDKLEQVYSELLQDEISRKTYLAVIYAFLKSDLSYIREVFRRNQYFDVAEFCTPMARDVFVDCGAYVGDSVEAYLGTQVGEVKRIYAFEPAEKNRIAMEHRMERLKREWALENDQVVIERKIVGNKSGVEYLSYHAVGNPSNTVVDKESSNCIEVEAISLDAYFADKEDKPTFIKADIEGSEMDLVLGAKNLIRDYKPRLAICIYHKLDDLYQLPLTIKEINPNYKMELRHHTPTYYETVLYCY